MLGMNERLFRQARGARILVYHGICKTDHTRFNSIFLQLQQFKAHLDFFQQYFHVVSLDEYYREQFSTEKFNICITFDDGFANNYKYVLPLMNSYRMPMAFFVTGIRQAGYDMLWNDCLCLAHKYGPGTLELMGDHFDRDQRGWYIHSSGKLLRDVLRDQNFNSKERLFHLVKPTIPEFILHKEEEYWLQMTEEEIRQLSSSPYATIGSHGYYHNDLAAIDASDAHDELVRSKQFLQEVTGKEITAVAFPYGSYSKEVVEAAKAAGYNQLLAADFLSAADANDPALRERFTVNPYISLNNQMMAIITGKYE